MEAVKPAACYHLRSMTFAVPPALALTLLLFTGCREQTVAADAAPALPDQTPPGDLARQDPNDVRLVSYNVYMDSAFVSGSPAAARFARLVKALDADVWALQEVYKTPSTDVAALFDKLLPLGVGKKWQARYGGDTVTVSRWPISKHHFWPVPSGGRNAALSLVDLPDASYNRDLYLLNNHFSCCGGAANEARRQKEADALVAWMRDARTAGGTIDLPAGTVMVVIGDLNTVGGPNPVTTLVTGDISDEATFGKDAPPDWDGSALTDARPAHAGGGAAEWTWRWDGSGYNPSRIDYVIYTDSAASVGRSFVLNTVALSNQQLAAAGLQTDDVIVKRTGGDIAFDHLPVVVDLRIKKK